MKKPPLIAFICAECSAIAYADIQSIDCGTTLTCESCSGKTVINLQTVAEYCCAAKMAALRADLKDATDEIKALRKVADAADKCDDYWRELHASLLNLNEAVDAARSKP